MRALLKVTGFTCKGEKMKKKYRYFGEKHLFSGMK